MKNIGQSYVEGKASHNFLFMAQDHTFVSQCLILCWSTAQTLAFLAYSDALN